MSVDQDVQRYIEAFKNIFKETSQNLTVIETFIIKETEGNRKINNMIPASRITRIRYEFIKYAASILAEKSPLHNLSIRAKVQSVCQALREHASTVIKSSDAVKEEPDLRVFTLIRKRISEAPQPVSVAPFTEEFSQFMENWETFSNAFHYSEPPFTRIMVQYAGYISEFLQSRVLKANEPAYSFLLDLMRRVFPNFKQNVQGDGPSVHDMLWVFEYLEQVIREDDLKLMTIKITEPQPPEFVANKQALQNSKIAATPKSKSTSRKKSKVSLTLGLTAAVLGLSALLIANAPAPRAEALKSLGSRTGRLSQLDAADAVAASRGLAPARLLLGDREALLAWLKGHRKYQKGALRGPEGAPLRVPSGLRTRAQWVRAFPGILEVALTDPSTGRRRRTAEVYRLVKAEASLVSIPTPKR